MLAVLALETAKLAVAGVPYRCLQLFPRPRVGCRSGIYKGPRKSFRGTSEFALESSQQAAACRTTLRQVWPDRLLDSLSQLLSEHCVPPALAVVLGVRSAREGIPISLALPAFMQSYVANLVTAGVRLVPLGQTDGQLAVARLEQAVLAASAQARNATIDDLGSAAFMVDLASMAHETQYTRLFRS